MNKKSSKRVVELPQKNWKKCFTLLLLSLTFIFASSTFAFAVEITSAEADAYITRSTVRVTTDVLTRVTLDVTGPDLQRSIDLTNPTTTHSFSIEDLDPDTTYQLAITATDLANNQDTTQIAFTTQILGAITFEIDAPLTSNGNPFDIRIQTLPDTSVLFFVNNEIRESILADGQGEIVISNVDLPLDREEHFLLFKYTLADEQYEQTHRVFVDAAPPVITLDPVATTTNDGAWSISGTVSEQSLVELISIEQATNTVQVEDQEESDNNFVLRAQLLDGQYTMVLRITDLAGNEVERRFVVQVDTRELLIVQHNMADLDPASTRSVTVRGQVNKPGATIVVFVNRDQNSRGGLKTCQDGIDNDGDGLIDFLEDKGCDDYDDTSEVDPNVLTDCNDGIDNDDDGYTDYLKDPGCDSLLDDDETDAEGTFDCYDGIDNDGDGDIDYLDDKGCSSQDDNDEGGFESRNDETFTTRADQNGFFSVDILLDTFFNAQNLGLTTDGGVVTDDIDTTRADESFGFGADYNNQEVENIVTLQAIDAIGNVVEETETIRYATCSSGGDWIVTIKDVYPGKILPDHVFEGIASLSFEVELEYVGPYAASIENIELIRQQLSAEENEDNAPESILDVSDCVVEPNGPQAYRGTYVQCQLNKWPSSTQDISQKYELFENLNTLNFPLSFVIDYSYVDFNGDVQSANPQRVCTDVSVFVDKRLPPDSIPEGLLNTTVDALDDTIDTIDSVLGPLSSLNLYTTLACGGTYLYDYVQQFGEELSCSALAGVNQNLRAQIEAYLRGAPLDKQSINDIYNSLNDRGVAIEEEQLQQSSACITKIQARLQFESYQNYICDRILCPSVPSAQTYIRDVNSGNPSDVSTSACAFDGPWGDTANVNSNFVPTEGCGKEYNDQWSPACLAFDPVEESKKQLNGSNGETSLLGKLSEFTNNLDFCQAQNAREGQDAFTIGDNTFVRESAQGPANGLYSLANVRTDYSVEDYTQTILDDEQAFESSVVSTTDANYGVEGIGASNYVQTVGGRLQFVPTYDNRYLLYEPNGASNEFINNDIGYGTRYDVGNGQTVYVDSNGNLYDTIGSDAKAIQTTANVCGDGEGGYKVCGEGDTPIRGPADLEPTVGSERLVEPTSSFINALRCVCLPAIEGFLFQIKSILEAIKNCFEAILYTGEFEAGACKAVLTQYLCNWVFEAIGCFIDSAGANTVGGTDQVPEVQRSFSALASAGKAVKERAQARYGNTATFNALITQRKLLHSVCLAAFGYDWVPDLQAAISVQGGDFAIGSEGSIFVATRYFTGSDPYNNGLTEHIYHVGYGLFAGSDLSWRLELVCSNTYDCNYPDMPNGACDCAHGDTQRTVIDPNAFNQQSGSTNPGDPRVSPTFTESSSSFATYSQGQVYGLTGGALRGGERVDPSQSEIYRRITSPVRYDKARLVWYSTSANVRDENRQGVVEQRIRQEGEGAPVATCSFQPQILAFRCNYVTEGITGDIYFSSNNPLRPDNTEVYGRDDVVRILADITVNHPENIDPNDRVPKFAKVSFYDPSGGLVGREYVVDDTNFRAGRDVSLPEGGFTPNAVVGSSPRVTVDRLTFVKGSFLEQEIDGRLVTPEPSVNQVNIENTLENPGNLYVVLSDVLDTEGPLPGDESPCEYQFLRSGSVTTPDTLTNPSSCFVSSQGDGVQITNIVTPSSDGQSEGTISFTLQHELDYVSWSGNYDYVTLEMSFNDPDTICVDGYQTYTARVTLHDSLYFVGGEQPRYGDARAAQDVFVYDGQQQEAEVEFRVSCN